MDVSRDMSEMQFIHLGFSGAGDDVAHVLLIFLEVPARVAANYADCAEWRRMNRKRGGRPT